MSKIILVIFFICAVEGLKLPKHWKKCKLNGTNQDECVREAMEFAVKDLSNGGNKELGIQTFDPMRIKSLEMNQGTGSFTFKVNLINIDLIGHKNIKILNVKFGTGMEVISWFPKFALKGQYNLRGKILALPLVGDGDFELEAVNFTTTWQTGLKRRIKHGKEYLELIKYNLSAVADQAHINFENLFNGDKALGASKNQFFNDNWREILKNIQPSLSKSFGGAIVNCGNQILSRVPVEDLFLK